MEPRDHELARRLEGFVPARVFDSHAHLFHRQHFVADRLPPLLPAETEQGWTHYQTAAREWLPGATTVDGLFFGFPSAGNDRAAINRWVAGQINADSRALALASPADQPAAVEQQIRELGLVGIKPYHVYAPSFPDTAQVRIEEFAPEWMWQICHSINGVMVLHIMRSRAIADPDNQAAIRRLCGRYPNCRLLLAHVARSFCYRHAREGLATLRDIDNAFVDTSAVTETDAFRAAIETLGPRRVLFGSDFPVSQMRGRCVALGDGFFWIHPAPPATETLVGLESLVCLQEACADTGLNRQDVDDIFFHNAQRLLAPRLAPAAESAPRTGPERWRHAREQISCGTGLLSKRAEMYDVDSWPAYFSKCHGAEVWDLDGRRYVDFTGGIGAVLLGYADLDVTRAVTRRLHLGTHGTLCSPDEVDLADLLLELHPWAQRVRYARGGGEALTMAVRIARAATGKSGIAFCGYHGWQDWYLAANLGDNAALDGHLLPGLQPLGVPRELQGTAVPFRYNDLASFETALQRLDGKLAGVVMEPMRSQRPADGFLDKVAQRCRAAGGVFMLDEVTSGWRFGFPGAWRELGIEPDIAVYAKAISNGFPCAAVVGRDTVMDAADSSFISSTYWTDGVGPAAALACIRTMRARDAQAQVWQQGGKLQRQLQALAARHPRVRLTIGGQPCAPSLAFDLAANAPAAKRVLIRRMLTHGFLVSGQWYVMLAHTNTHIDTLVSKLDLVLGEIGQLLESDRLAAEAGPLTNSPTAAGFARLA